MSALQPTARTFDLDGGARVYVESLHALPLVSVTVAFRTGSSFDPPEVEGAVRMAARMLRRGCEGMDANAIEAMVDRLGGDLSIDLSPTSLSFQGQVIGRNLDAFIDLLARVLSSPTNDANELERLKRETIAELIEARDNDRGLAQNAFRRMVFGPHPYARSALGTPSGIEAVGIDAVKALQAKHLVRGNVVFGFAGDVTAERAKELAERIAQKLPAGASLLDGVPAPTHAKGRRLIFVDKPERTQTQIMLGGLGTWPKDEDHVALGVANAVFGGTFTSRMMKAIRSERGWSYGAYSRLAIDRQRQAFSMWAFPAATDAAACLALELELLEKYVNDGITEEETAFIRQFLVRSQAFEIDTAPKRLTQTMDIEILGLPADYHSGYADRVAKVTREDASRAAKNRISVDDVSIVVVGTASELRESIEKAIPRLVSVEVRPFDRE